MHLYMYVHTRERDSRPGFDGVKIKLLLLLLLRQQIFSVHIFLPYNVYLYLYSKGVLQMICSGSNSTPTKNYGVYEEITLKTLIV